MIQLNITDYFILILILIICFTFFITQKENFNVDMCNYSCNEECEENQINNTDTIFGEKISSHCSDTTRKNDRFFPDTELQESEFDEIIDMAIDLKNNIFNFFNEVIDFKDVNLKSNPIQKMNIFIEYLYYGSKDKFFNIFNNSVYLNNNINRINDLKNIQYFISNIVSRIDDEYKFDENSNLNLTEIIQYVIDNKSKENFEGIPLFDDNVIRILNNIKQEFSDLNVFNKSLLDFENDNDLTQKHIEKALLEIFQIFLGLLTNVNNNIYIGGNSSVFYVIINTFLRFMGLSLNDNFELNSISNIVSQEFNRSAFKNEEFDSYKTKILNKITSIDSNIFNDYKYKLMILNTFKNIKKKTTISMTIINNDFNNYIKNKLLNLENNFDTLDINSKMKYIALLKTHLIELNIFKKLENFTQENLTTLLEDKYFYSQNLKEFLIDNFYAQKNKILQNASEFYNNIFSSLSDEYLDYSESVDSEPIFIYSSTVYTESNIILRLINRSFGIFTESIKGTESNKLFECFFNYYIDNDSSIEDLSIAASYIEKIHDNLGEIIFNSRINEIESLNINIENLNQKSQLLDEKFNQLLETFNYNISNFKEDRSYIKDIFNFINSNNVYVPLTLFNSLIPNYLLGKSEFDRLIDHSYGDISGKLKGLNGITIPDQTENNIKAIDLENTLIDHLENYKTVDTKIQNRFNLIPRVVVRYQESILRRNVDGSKFDAIPEFISRNEEGDIDILQIICIILLSNLLFNIDEDDSAFPYSFKNIICFNFYPTLKHAVQAFKNLNIEKIFQDNTTFTPFIERIKTLKSDTVDLLEIILDLLCTSKFTENGEIENTSSDLKESTNTGLCNVRSEFNNLNYFVNNDDDYNC